MEGDYDPSFFDDLVGLDLVVPCNTWNEKEAEKCFGPEWKQKSIQGFITRVKWNRTKNAPLFDVKFPNKKGYKDFYGLDLDYILSYSDEIPLKYHKLKAQFIVRVASAASNLPIQKPPDEMKAGSDDVHISEEETDSEGNETAACQHSKKRSQKTNHKNSRKKIFINNDDNLECMRSDIASDTDDENDTVSQIYAPHVLDNLCL